MPGARAHSAVQPRPSMSLGARLRNVILKPVDQSTPAAQQQSKRRPVGELQAAAKSADDRERLIGLAAAPAAAVIGLLVINALIANDPPALLKSGQHNKLHVSTTLYH